MILLGLDVGLANLGYAITRLQRDSEELLAFGVFCTEKSDRKQSVLAADDDTRRVRELWRCLRNLTIGIYRPRAICVEAASLPRNASAAAKTSQARGLIAALAEELGDLPIIQASPQQVKKAVCGARDASKADVEAAVCQRYGNAAALAVAGKLRKGDREHAFDAVAVTIACLPSDVVRMLRGVCELERQRGRA